MARSVSQRDDGLTLLQTRIRETALEAFVDFANADLTRTDWTTLRRLLIGISLGAFGPGIAIVPDVPFVIWATKERLLTYPKGVSLRNSPTRRDAVALQTKLREELLAKIYPSDVAPESVAEKPWVQVETWILPVTTSVYLQWPKSQIAGRPRREGAPSSGSSRILASISHGYMAKWPDVFWLGVMMVLEQNGDRIRRCGQCHKLFAIRTRRQEYCTDTCSLRGRQRKWNMVHSDEVKKRRAAA